MGGLRDALSWTSLPLEYSCPWIVASESDTRRRHTPKPVSKLAWDAQG